MVSPLQEEPVELSIYVFAVKRVVCVHVHDNVEMLPVA